MSLLDKLNVSIHDNPMGSGHFSLNIELNIEKSVYSKMSFKIKAKRTDWAVFESNMAQYYPEFLQPNYDKLSAVKKYQFLVEKISLALKEATPKKSGKKVNLSKKSNPVVWWDSDCARVIRLRKAAIKKVGIFRKID